MKSDISVRDDFVCICMSCSFVREICLRIVEFPEELKKIQSRIWVSTPLFLANLVSCAYYQLPERRDFLAMSQGVKSTGLMGLAGIVWCIAEILFGHLCDFFERWDFRQEHSLILVLVSLHSNVDRHHFRPACRFGSQNYFQKRNLVDQTFFRLWKHHVIFSFNWRRSLCTWTSTW